MTETSLPDVVRRRGVDGAAAARGHVVVIDVLRAFSTAAYAFGAGAESVTVVGTPDEAFALRDQIGAAAFLAGEIGGKPIEGFDLGNSPDAMSRLDLTGRRVVLRSSSGTQGVVRATGAERVLLGSLAVAGATARWLLAREVSLVTVVPMGAPNGPDGPEDEACADVLEALLADGSPDHTAAIMKVRESPAARIVEDPRVDWMTTGDVDRACEIDRFDFAMVVGEEDGVLVARAERS